MKYILIIVFAVSVIFPLSAQKDEESSVTTYYLVRHAEKNQTDKNNKNPSLTESGKERAQNWSNVFQYINLSSIYSTNYNRTIQTATPTAEIQGLDIQFYDPKTLLSENFLKATQGKNILIVGHSNTTPDLANGLLGKQKFDYMEDNDYGSLYIITITTNHKIDQVLKIN